MVAFPSDMRKRLAATLPRGDKLVIPAFYSKLTQTQRAKARNAYVERQQGLCAHCGHPLSEQPPWSITDKIINWNAFPGGRVGFLRNPIHLHHDHDTDLTIGAVHAYCNAVLWQYHGR